MIQLKIQEMLPYIEPEHEAASPVELNMMEFSLPTVPAGALGQQSLPTHFRA